MAFQIGPLWQNGINELYPTKYHRYILLYGWGIGLIGELR